ncbi:hypothetical protein BKA61DRAFT_498652 [Leptodontidium sp. MPI-SDFR-AT-0119]|nr:hypothetical protein BKA61DRAFT_498652 [Leptodontidium sp. MPI-SDFR-AT-0119]
MAVLAWTSGLVWFWHYKEKSPYALTLRGHCGYSVAEAKANDCIYDIMLSSWVSKPCYNKELSDIYLAANNFTYYEHSNALVEIPEEEVRKGEFTRIFTHFNYHTQHCIYLWNLQILAAKMRRPVLDSISRNQRHIEHCFHLITAVTGPNYTTWNQPITGTPIHVRPMDLKCWEG